jgi:hypothetical protein
MDARPSSRTGRDEVTKLQEERGGGLDTVHNISLGPKPGPFLVERCWQYIITSEKGHEQQKPVCSMGG